MPILPTALPDRVKIRTLIWERGYKISDLARKIGRPPHAIYAITGRTQPKPVGIALLRQLAAALSTPKRPVKVSDISDWTGDDDLDEEPEPKALASLDTKKAPAARTTGAERERKPAPSITTSKGENPE